MINIFIRHGWIINTAIGDQSGIWHHARIEVLDKWNGISYDPKLEIGNHVMIGQDFHVACADSIKIEDNVLISAGVFITDLDHVTADKDRAGAMRIRY